MNPKGGMKTSKLKGLSNRQKRLLQALHKAKTARRKVIIRDANKELIMTLVECVVNIIKGNVKLTSAQLKKLRPHEQMLKRFIKKSTSTKSKREIISEDLSLNQGGGFLGAILGPIAKLLLGGLFTPK